MLGTQVGWDEWIRGVEIVPAIAGTQAVARKDDVQSLLRNGCRVFHLNTTDLASRQAAEAVALLAPLVHYYEGALDVYAAGADIKYIAAAGADSVTFDAGGVFDVAAAVESIREGGAQVGIAFGNWVPEEEVAERAGSADLIACGGRFGAVVNRVKRLVELLPSSVTIQVTGGVRQANVRPFAQAGAKLLVVDEAQLLDRGDVPRAYRQLVEALP